MVYIHRPLSRLHHSPIESISSCAPPLPPHDVTGQEDRAYWLHTKKCLEAAEISINLYTLPIPILQHSPLGICGIVFSTLANLSACAHILNGPEWYRTRDRIRLGLGSLKKFGEVWATSRRSERETKKIARSVFSLPRPGEALGSQEQQQSMQTIGDDRHFDFQMMADNSQAQGQMGMTAYEDMSIMGGNIPGVNFDYLTMLESAQTMSHVHS